MSDHIDRLLDRARNANAANASGPVANRTRTPAELELTEALQAQQQEWEAGHA